MQKNQQEGMMYALQQHSERYHRHTATIAPDVLKFGYEPHSVPLAPQSQE
jgi:hypothetical protein